jgi:diguanylate cyclase (GGDEF)-like protein
MMEHVHGSGEDRHRAFGRWLLVVVGLGLLGASVGFGVAGNRDAAKTSRDKTLLAQVSLQSQLLEEYFDRARGFLLVSAQSPAFRDFYRSPASREVTLAAGGPLVDDVTAALSYLESLYPRGVLEEVCFIDRNGAENARVVAARVAQRDELSSSELENLFFAPTLATVPGEVFQAAPYISPDTHQWVISNSTTVQADGVQQAILHFEVGLDSFRFALKNAGPNHTVIVDADTGRIVLDVDDPLRPGGPLGDPADDRFLKLAGTQSTHGLISTSGSRIAYQRVATRATNANHWLVVTETGVAGGISNGFGLGPNLMVLSALFMLVFALSSWRSHTRRLALAAVTDNLTGLPNRVLLHDRITQGIHLASRNGSAAAVLLLDLDRFKEVNDTLGHDKGDLLLIEVADRLRSVVRPCDTVARLGGDEFTVFLPAIGRIDDACVTAGRILRVLSEPCSIEGTSIHLSASIGVASFPSDGDDADLLVQHADVAMYEAKRRHQGFVVYRPDNDGYTARRLRFAAELGVAIDERQLIVHYQPKVDLITGEAAGVEALVRWAHPELGLIPPADFISIAEDTGLIGALTMTVLDQTLERMRLWKDQGREQHVSVNLSARSLVDFDLPQAVAGLLGRHGVDGTSLTFEITETAIIADHDSAVSILTALHRLGIALSIDDFGTGYFSLSELRDLPIDEIKIDRGFVSSMSSEEKDAFIVRSTIALGKNLGLRVVAEGVEDSATLHELRWLGCDIAQGFLMSQPLHGDQVIPWLNTWQEQRTEQWGPINHRHHSAPC